MRLRTVLAALAAARVADAFRDTAPFFLFSTSRFPDTLDAKTILSISTAERTEAVVSEALAGCPSDVYILVSQPGASVEDFTGDSHAPHWQMMAGESSRNVESRYIVKNVVGGISQAPIMETLSKCSVETIDLLPNTLPAPSLTRPSTIRVEFDALPLAAGQRASALSHNDAFLHTLIEVLKAERYTVIYTSPPRSEKEYESIHEGEQEQLYRMDEPYPSTADSEHFKRDTTAYPRADDESGLNDGVPLFEKYEFFSSGIFMGGTVALVLLGILYVGITAVAGLEVSYMAFSKEMNPANQKKQQ